MLDPVLIPVLSFVGTLAVVVVGFLYSNRRITDLRISIQAQFEAYQKQLEAYQKQLEAYQKQLQAYQETNEANFRRLEDVMLHKFAELDNRLSRLEGRRL
ncbi:MAG: hypothetical protein HYS04_03135 [Acidobacteria bacterium]|nr:hypothetical protein [Acidobacteriota bacterium]